MNKKIALSAIAMFAVTLGLGVLSPAMADKPVDGVHDKPQICHFSEAKNIFNATGDDTWTNSTAGMKVIEVDNQGKMNGHFIKGTDPLEPRHGNATLNLWDFPINATTGSGQEVTDCLPEIQTTNG
jgi:hypothetical protein